MEVQNFEIKLPQFEGPFDLLLFFIEREELAIHDIPIASITDDFLSYIHQMNALNMEMASEFIFVAATLMRIKAKMLLPRPDLDEEGNEVDLKQDLIQKLIVYKQFKDICETLKHLEEKRAMLEKRGNIIQNLQIITKDADPGEVLTSFDLYKLMRVFYKLIKEYMQRATPIKHIVIKYPYTIEKQKETIASLIAINNKLDFTELKKQSENRIHFVYNFLAILEMLQQQLLDMDSGIGYNNFLIRGKL